MEFLRSDLVYDGSPWINVFKETLKTGRGKQVNDFRYVETCDFALLFARTKDARVVMVRQWRQGPTRFAFSFPRGHIEPDEDPAETAKHELSEEAGFKVDAVRPPGRFCMHSNFGVGWGHFYCAEDSTEIGRILNPDLEIARPRLLTNCEI